MLVRQFKLRIFVLIQIPSLIPIKVTQSYQSFQISNKILVKSDLTDVGAGTWKSYKQVPDSEKIHVKTFFYENISSK